MQLYTKGSIATTRGVYIIGKDTDNAKPWSVFLERNGRVDQVGKWYTYRGWAERKMKKVLTEQPPCANIKA